ncbi:MAG: hypothetical protein DLM53_05800 [Candidatus Eremiobacter antarcticus]|nr:alpha/beta fold hydrolase [Candidatus Eremiobacteraeota bacterium]PZR62332.1 MAG: hypothetical protein DLM53_05800 [Candidatus Eremiobacter sp. RRmetagenome_bin22]
MAAKTGFASVNGTQLYYEEAGEGTSVVFIHGLGLDRRMWDEQFQEFAGRYRVIRYDVRGFGKSDVPSDSPFRHVDDLRALLDYLAAPKSHIIGFSMGGIVALHHALLHPDATLSLVLADSALDGHPWSAEWDESVDAVWEHAAKAGAKAGNDKWLEHDLFGPAREQPHVKAKLAQIVGESSGWNWVNESPVQGIDPRSIDRLHDISAPTIVIVGERDLADFRTIATTLTQAIPGARKVVIEGAGHMSNIEKAPEFNSIVSSFLEEVETRAA